MQLIRLRAYRSVCPCLEPLREQRALFPGQVVAVGVVTELLKLHRRHSTAALKNVRGDVLNVWHGCLRTEPAGACPHDYSSCHCQATVTSISYGLHLPRLALT